MPIHTADILFNETGTPVSSQFDDVYFSNDNGLLETRYVFIDNNHLLQRWQTCKQHHFVIAETGFGTGLNFLLTLQLFTQFRHENPDHPLRQLYFISFEKYPITAQDLTLALQAWPSLKEEAKQLLAQYPLPIAGCHRLSFTHAPHCEIYLDLWLGDVNTLLPTFSNTTNQSIDAWFLDGFAPSKNPDMWQEKLFQYIAQLTAPNGTFATFTAAGIVKRGLQDVGFHIEKVKGFGKKRDMLRGTFTNHGAFDASRLSRESEPRYWHRSSVCQKTRHITVIGGGLAGLNTAHALLKHGYAVSLYEGAPTLANGASGNQQGGFYPNLNIDFTLASQIYALAFLYAKRHYRTLMQQGFHFEHDTCGVLLLAFNDKQAARHAHLVEKQNWPQTLVDSVSQQQAKNIANVELPFGGLFIPEGGWINPYSLVQALSKACYAYANFELVLGTKITDMQRDLSQNKANKWCLSAQGAPSLETDAVVLALGHHSRHFPTLNGLPLQSVRGQVETMSSQGELANLRTVLCHKGYLTPALNNTHALGATFGKDDETTDYRVSEEAANLHNLKHALPNMPWVENLVGKQTGRASIRCASPDRLPLMGQLPDLEKQQAQYKEIYKTYANHKYAHPTNIDNVFVLTGLGSRGLCTAPLLAEALACQISGKPLPLSQAQLNALSPNRFLIRQLIRREI
ncbi:bifunctional tRNA (5-methylaminomethyl-2-thiouridine)(34)-methyltransferase MnmD/FAD-dependent 5-carboxymethylaminomethyl-2-thiouridine(34) oxidoreductase MnmC [Alteromonas sp. a30]|uniref:bifunctional tRNA (5-methylaminomethyl-2-thiouridine)(34)-methyltransferase MnmD/FAD-dependent 5-carboxymethylaminomethyl-2-thiouridine(34) oxidoreductase MnmC n=1 Tax=Alteromonas sp. a30 TaxID=2730917 RepID=UPI0022817135|nr:bifunctional tRNA (5-methylaminomethyl-2-thiouridine)(34)-methyltransferase MnmD/FAD-dependent 5-carboxymethylaminomethyl-2-thiouridine(34) oxidoreductase MnmC [Alteromonas sp. a30]MCY7296567.1 bifunctional tRNA (5-methylaminomethyl-2-thiouridine)(34)-methyltransferase MnmD/FAD-dependent 5-carboxymethylaminomethyl-2-thiouridine(34) oxidoreductase MnmC [Alteromonas sp. a30]